MVTPIGGTDLLARIAAHTANIPPVPLDSPTVETPEQARERREAADSGRRRAWEKMRPRGFATASLDDLAPDQHPRTLREWLDGDSRTLILTGKVGPGKSHAAYAIGNAAFDRGVAVAAWSVVTLMAELRPSSSDEDRPARVMERACEWPLVILDDLGQENVSEWVAEQMFRIVDARNTNGLRTIVTANIGADAIRMRYGAAVLDRLEQDAVVVKFEGRSRRLPRF